MKIDDNFDKAISRALNTLFDHISGPNRCVSKLEMMTQALQRSGTEADSFVVSFVLPLRFDAGIEPAPTDPEVRIREVPTRTMAVSRYPGLWSEARYKRHEADLIEALEAAGYQVLDSPKWARYNSASTPWLLRRNQVMVELRQGHGG